MKSIQTTKKRISKIEAIAQTKLLSAWEFHRLCKNALYPLYFGEFPASILDRVVGSPLKNCASFVTI
ncbi:hypothetical protein [Baaleninema sp.]|uniref:hypothetical protein n=1 Tax=Baaleninema sp. TaxID=3101197 RepID=UPI003D035292